MRMNDTKNILVAPLNWGLGHATRCIPVIKELINHGFNPIIASDGGALELLKKEFPELTFEVLPAYSIEYQKNGESFKWKLIKNLPQIITAASKEHKVVQQLVEKHQLTGIISDNRFGAYSKKIPSVYITHLLNVLTGKTTTISSELHHYVIKKYTECWVPDWYNSPNLSGKLGHVKKDLFPTRYIGPLSRFTKIEAPLKYKLLVLLSGPEPQRSLLEAILVKELQDYIGEIAFVKGQIEEQQIIQKVKNITYSNFMTTPELGQAIAESSIIVCRSGYSTIMDLTVMEKKAFFIPTPGQYEQEYLAERLSKKGIVPSCSQEEFSIDRLYKSHLFEGLKKLQGKTPDWENLFGLFEGKRKF